MATITITSTSDFPPHKTSIRCTVGFYYRNWKAKLETSYSTAADDKFDDDFELVGRNDAMREEEGGPYLLVGGIDDRGYQILVVSVDTGSDAGVCADGILAVCEALR
ncbi:MAG: hypothetical protein Q9184_007566 [Pyrenodesmia sp. 2 TL-2023]